MSEEEQLKTTRENIMEKKKNESIYHDRFNLASVQCEHMLRHEKRFLFFFFYFQTFFPINTTLLLIPWDKFI